MENRIYKVRLHRQRPTDRNPYIAVLAMWGDNSWCYRTFQRRSIDSFWLLERDMTAAEKIDYERRWRYFWLAYKSWEELIGDEYRVTRDTSWCSQLHTVSGINASLETVLAGIKN